MDKNSQIGLQDSSCLLGSFRPVGEIILSGSMDGQTTKSKTLHESSGDTGQAQMSETLQKKTGTVYGKHGATVPTRAVNTGTPLTPDLTMGILSKLHSIKPWQIKPEDRKAVRNALQLLEYALIPTDYDSAAYWIGRLLAHFPRRDSTKDAIIVADLSGVIVDENLSVIAVAKACDEIWKSSSNENPWLPASGEILKRIQDQEESYQTMYRRLVNPLPVLPQPKPKEPEPKKYGADKWADMTEEARARFVNDQSSLWPSLRKIMYRVYDAPYEKAHKQNEQ